MHSLVVRETALNMYFMDGHSYQHVARVLDIPLDTVKLWVAVLIIFHRFSLMHRKPICTL